MPNPGRKHGDPIETHVKVYSGEKPPGGARFPTTQREMQLHMSGRHPDQFRGPLNREERRKWDKFWKMGGRGFTRPMFASSETRRRKERQANQSSNWTAKREANNLAKGLK